MKYLTIIFSLLFISCNPVGNNRDSDNKLNEDEINKNNYRKNIADFVYIETLRTNEIGDKWILHNKTNYTIDKVLIEVVVPHSVGGITTYLKGNIEKNYIKAHSETEIIYSDFHIPLYPDGLKQLKRGMLKPEIKLIKSENIGI